LPPAVGFILVNQRQPVHGGRGEVIVVICHVDWSNVLVDKYLHPGPRKPRTSISRPLLGAWVGDGSAFLAPGLVVRRRDREISPADVYHNLLVFAHVAKEDGTRQARLTTCNGTGGLEMRQTQIRKPTKRTTVKELDLRSPLGRILPF
jgi:hypothetical protein